MHFIVYLSDYTGSNDQVNGALEDIVRVSKVNNKCRGVTGALFYHEGTFLQAIEGERENLDELLATVGEDERHNNIKIILDEEVSCRSFGEWNMDSFNLDKSGNLDEDVLNRFKQFFNAQMQMDGTTFIGVLKSVLGNPGLLEAYH